jgi:hypothetical protein
LPLCVNQNAIWDRLELSEWDLEEHDAEALWDLATSPSHAKATFLSSMLQNEARARRFNRHPDVCLQAALGMSLDLKRLALEEVDCSLQDASTVQRRAAAVAVGIRLATSPSMLARIGLSAVKLLSISDEGTASLRSFAETGAVKVEPEAARELLDAILAAVRQTTDPSQLRALAQTAQGLPIEIEAAAARELLDKILAAVRQTADPSRLQALAQTAQGLTPKLEAAAARELLDAILAAVRQTTDPDRLQALAQTAQGLTPKLEAAAARQLLDAILAAVRQTTHPSQLQAQAQTAQGLTSKLEAAAVRELLDAILAAVRQTTHPSQLQALVQVVTQLGTRQTDADQAELISAWRRCVASSLELDEEAIAIGAALLDQYDDTALAAIVADVMSYPTIDQKPLGALIKILQHRFDEIEHLEPDKWEIASWMECRFA